MNACACRRFPRAFTRTHARAHTHTHTHAHAHAHTYTRQPLMSEEAQQSAGILRPLIRLQPSSLALPGHIVLPPYLTRERESQRHSGSSQGGSGSGRGAGGGRGTSSDDGFGGGSAEKNSGFGGGVGVSGSSGGGGGGSGSSEWSSSEHSACAHTFPVFRRIRLVNFHPADHEALALRSITLHRLRKLPSVAAAAAAADQPTPMPTPMPMNGTRRTSSDDVRAPNLICESMQRQLEAWLSDAKSRQEPVLIHQNMVVQLPSSLSDGVGGTGTGVGEVGSSTNGGGATMLSLPAVGAGVDSESLNRFAIVMELVSRNLCLSW